MALSACQNEGTNCKPMSCRAKLPNCCVCPMECQKRNSRIGVSLVGCCYDVFNGESMPLKNAYVLVRRTVEHRRVSRATPFPPHDFCDYDETRLTANSRNEWLDVLIIDVQAHGIQ